jgi:hypothetical protein
MKKKTSITIIASIALSFALFFTLSDLNLALGQSASTATVAGNSTSQNQTSSSRNQTPSGNIGEGGQSQSHSAQSQSQSGPVGQVGQSQFGSAGQLSQGPLSSQIEKQLQINSANQTGRSEHF